MCPSPLRALALLLCAMPLGACQTSSVPVVVKPQPGAALLLPCVDPAIAKADGATDTDVALTIVNLGKAYADCRQRHADLARWVRE